MALQLKRLIRNLANLKNKETAKNKFLKTKPKIQEMKQNVEKATEEAVAVHDYVKRATVQPDRDKVVPLLERDSFSKGFEYIGDQLSSIGQIIPGTNPPQIQSMATAAAAIKQFASQMELGIVVTNGGSRYLTTRARATELGGSFTPITNSLANSFASATLRIK